MNEAVRQRLRGDTPARRNGCVEPGELHAIEAHASALRFLAVVAPRPAREPASSMSLYYLNVTVHVLAALLWLGGIFFLGAVGAPALRAVEPAALRAELFRRLGERFRLVGWLAILVLIITGVLNLHFRGFLSRETLGAREFWATPFGHALAWKLAAVAIILLVQAFHDFVLGPRASRLQPGSPEALRSHLINDTHASTA